MLSYRKVSMMVSTILLSIVFMNVFAALVTPSIASVNAGDSNIPAGYELIRTVGGLDTPIGLSVIVASTMLLVIALAIWQSRPWEIAAMFFLGADITLKLVNITALLATGGAFTDTLLAFGVILVEVGLIGVLYRRYTANRRPVQATRA